MVEWRPHLAAGGGYVHQRIVAALEADIRDGRLATHARLPTHRRLSELLEVGVGAVTRAYAEAETRGLVTAQVGRGTFVAGPASREPDGALAAAGIDLARNLPPAGQAEARLAETLSRLRKRGDLLAHLEYPPPAGMESHRRAGAAWLGETAYGRAHASWLADGARGADVDWRRVIVTGGAQQAAAIALGAVARPGDAVLVEGATFSGIKALAAHMGYRLLAGDMDAEGLTPAALDAAASGGARVVYLQPLQNPTGRIMSATRRREIVEVARRRALFLVEDDLYAAYAAELGLSPLAALAPDRVFYVSGLSKSIAPGLRVGYCVAPVGDGWMEAALGALRAIAFGPPGLGALVATQWIEDGTGFDILRAHRGELAVRTRLALDILGPSVARPANAATPHLWLPLGELEAERAAARSLREGVRVTDPGAPIVPGGVEHGLRVCLGAAPTRAVLEQGLRVVARALAADEAPALGVV